MAKIIIGGEAPHQVTIDNGGGNYEVDFVALTSDPKAIFVGPGTYDLSVKASFLTSYTIEAKGGAVVNIDDTFSLLTRTNLVIDGASSISLGQEYSALSLTTVDFQGSGGTLTLPPGKLDLLEPLPVVSGFGAGDHIDFNSPAGAGDSIVYKPTGPNSGTLILENSSGHPLGAVTLKGSYTPGDFYVGTAPDGTAVIDFACFLRGTRIRNEDGEDVAVETLQAGDKVMTLANGTVTVKAVRRRYFTRTADILSPKVRPVVILAGALGENLPLRDLSVSPDHSMFIDGFLVPAQLLVNGTTITQPWHLGAVIYHHVEIEPHDIIIAEGAASESYLDIGNRGHFAQPGVIALFPDHEPKGWEDACAPLLLAGPELDAITSRLEERAVALSETKEAVSAAA